MTVLFLHGVPDTPVVWDPLIAACGLAKNEVLTPALPGFAGPAPRGFACTKDAYLDWLIAECEQAVAAKGEPIHIVGHDWGGLLTARVVTLRPDLFASWSCCSGLAGPGKRWHGLARKWQTPIMGEIVMLLMTKTKIKQVFIDQGMTPELAEIEAAALKAPMKSAILKLYRSALTIREDWPPEPARMPKRGILVWGADDPFVPLGFAQEFGRKHGFPVHVEDGAKHWGIVDRAATIAPVLKAHWAG